MKRTNRSNCLIPLFVACICLLALGCNGDKPLHLNPSQAESVLPAQPTRKAAAVLMYYLDLKDALVASGSNDARLAAGAMRIALVSFLQDSTLMSGNEILLHKVRGTTDTLLIQLDSLLSNEDVSCEQQRIFFKPVSEAMYRFLQEIDMHHIMLYRQLCPMALNEQGAYWLSLSPDIENPYFGNKMLTCGELIDTIK